MMLNKVMITPTMNLSVCFQKGVRNIRMIQPTIAMVEQIWKIVSGFMAVDFVAGIKVKRIREYSNSDYTD